MLSLASRHAADPRCASEHGDVAAMNLTLYCIPLSHYCERARWALDLTNHAYCERHELQGFAGRVTLKLGATKTVPVLVVDGSVVDDSSDIVAWAARHGAPSLDTADHIETDALQAEFAQVLGVQTRRLAYDWIFASFPRVVTYNTGAAPRYQEAALRVCRPLLARRLRRYFDLSAAGLQHARDTVNRGFDQVADRLSDGRPYLMGETFGAADLTFAAMAAPCLSPPQYGVPLPPLDAFDGTAQTEVMRYRAHPAGQFALRLYQQRPRPRGVLHRSLRVPRQ